MTLCKILFIAIGFIVIGVSCEAQNDDSKPNILWISCEDITTMLGSYGDPNAKTPHLDAFAKKAVQYTNAFATAPVCSPSRSCIVTGVYATSLGTQHLRSHTEIPDRIIPFPKYLREAGYYVSNNQKEDYNFTDETIWDESTNKAHWRNREDPKQPFFSVFNLGITHQSGIFGNDSIYDAKIESFLPFVNQADPDSLLLIPYYPDTPGIRKLWARYYTNVSIMDYQFSQILQELEEDGLMENTIIFFFSDHGTGMPRSKRATYDSGLKIPLLVFAPPKWQDKFNILPGIVNDQLVSFIDFAPTLLELAGLTQPDVFQGQPFISEGQLDQKSYVFGTSDRVDEAYELTRTIRTKDFRYVRNFLPHLSLLQPNYYTDRSEIMKELSRVNKNDLTEDQKSLFTSSRKAEELYLIRDDPNEINNLAYDRKYREVIQEMRRRLNGQIIRSKDTGLMPEPEMIRLSTGGTPYDLANNESEYPLAEILSACDLLLLDNREVTEILRFLNHPNGFVRYWTLMGMQSFEVSDQRIDKKIETLLNDDFPTVRIEAASYLIEKGNPEALSVLNRHLTNSDYIALYAARTYQGLSDELDILPDEFLSLYEQLKRETNDGSLGTKNYYQLYTYWSLSETLADRL